MSQNEQAITSPANASVLIVDDEEASLFSMRLAVESLGYQVKTAANGPAALKIAGEETPDIIILDLVMPEMDGFEVCRRLKDDPRSANIPIIFLSGLSASDDKLKAFEAGGVDYLVKPCSTTGLFVRLRTHLSLQNTQNRLTTEVRKRTMELEEKNHELRETNIVLKRLLHEIEEEKLKIGEVMRLNIERLILPDLDRMSQAPAEQSNQLRDTIRTNLLDITRPLAGENTGVYSALTPTELRVLNLIRQGQASKEIAAMLNIASQTVATHRKSIRKKLNISGKKINLVSFLNRSDRNHLI